MQCQAKRIIKIIAQFHVFLLLVQMSKCQGGRNPKGGPKPPPKTDEFVGHISVGLAFNQKLQGDQQEWTVKLRAGQGRRIELLFVDFFVSHNSSCNTDTGPYIKIESIGMSPDDHFMTSSVPLKTELQYFLCGSVKDMKERVWLMDTPAVTIIFRHLHSSASRLFITYRGIHKLQPADYCSHQSAGNSGVFRTTTENGYKPLTRCSALLSVGNGKRMVITIKYVELEHSGKSCEYDKLLIYDGPSNDSPVLGRYCGVLEYIKLYPQSYRVFVVFESDVTGTAGGFEVQYNTTDQRSTSKTIRGVVKLPVQTEGSISCITGQRCTPSFQRNDEGIFVWEIAVPVGHDIFLSWNASEYFQFSNEDNETGYHLYIYGGRATYSIEQEVPLLSVNASTGRQTFRTSSLTIYLAVLSGVRVHLNVDYKSLYHVKNVPRECNKPASRQVMVTFVYTEIIFKVTKQIVNCVWVFRASNKHNFVKLKIEKTTNLDNACDILGYAVYDGDAPSDKYKMRGPFCRRSDPITIFSTQEYMTVVFFVTKNTDENVNVRAFVSETDCIPVYSDSPNAVDVSHRPCFHLLDIPHELSNTSIQKSFPITNLTQLSQIQFMKDWSSGFKCLFKTGCLQVYLQPSPNLPICDYEQLQSRIPEIISSCPVPESTQLAFRNLNFPSPLSEQCVELYCDEINNPVTSRSCGRFSLLVNEKSNLGACQLILRRNSQDCQSNGTSRFFQYRLRFTANNEESRHPTVKEKIFAKPCGEKYSEHVYSINRKYGGINVVYTVSTDYVEIKIARKYWFTLDFDLVEVEVPPVKSSVSDCPARDYFQRNGNCYSLRQFRLGEPATWGHAQRQCKNDGAQLVSIADENQLTFLKQMLASYWRNRAFQKPYLLIYIGLKGEGGDGSWIDGTQFRFSDWHTHLYSDRTTEEETTFEEWDEISTIIPRNRLQPIREEFSLCTVMYISEPSVRPQYKTHWAKLPCNYPFPNSLYICEKASILPQGPPNNFTVKIHLKHRCPDKWTFMNGYCVRMITSLQSLFTSLTYTNAKGMCHEKGGRMARITHEDSTAIIYLLSLWKHQPQYRGIWLEKVNTTCRVINPRKNVWKTLSLQVDGIYENVVDYEFIEFDCDTSPPFIWTIRPLNHSEYLKHSEWQGRKAHFPNGPLNVLCERDVITHSTRCGAHQHTCQDGSCILEAQLCDGYLDCVEGDDEESCGCKNAFRCQSGECLPYSLYCDHVNHCKDGSDEANCTYPNCSVGEFRCADGMCIEMNRTCDLIKDCRSGEDESTEQCDWAASCVNGFHCYSGTCIPVSRQNDLQADCPTFTGEDELLKYTDSIKGEVNIGSGGNTIVTVNYTSFCPKNDEVRCIPHHPKCFQRDKACVYNVDRYMKPVVEGCRDFSHLKNCSRFECPGMFKCPKSFCIYLSRVCDGTEDCVNGEDEVNCDEYKCPGLLRCPGQRSCIEQQFICDGQEDCANGEDEKYCDLTKDCPDSCTCTGLVMSCVNGSLTSIPTYSKNLRALMLSNNSLELLRNTFQGYHYVGVLDISFNNIKTIPQYAFQGLKNLLLLKLNGNQITHLTEHTFGGVNIRHVDLSNNKLISISSYAFSGYVGILNIENNNRNLEIDLDAFKDLRMDSLYTDAHRYCCALNDSVKCLPEPGEFSSCEDLLADTFLRYAIWVIGMMAFFGNLAVFIWRLKTERQNVNSFLILNLSVSDFIMGVYLLIIAASDQYFDSRGAFFQYEQKWKEGFLCQFEGFISTVACEMSVFTLVVITIDRVLILVFTFKVNALSRKSAAIVESIGWVTCCVIAAVPLLVYDDLYYGSTSVCLPFTLRDTSSIGWKYSTTIFIALNLFCFVVIAGGYIWIYVYARQQRLKSQRKSSARDLALARRLVLIVLTDFFCWVPISIIGIVALSGVTISRQVSAWVAVFVMPINSALNPILYTFSSMKPKVCCLPEYLHGQSHSSDDAKLKPFKKKGMNDIPSSHTDDTPLTTPATRRRPGTPNPSRNTGSGNYLNKVLDESKAKRSEALSVSDIKLTEHRTGHDEATVDGTSKSFFSLVNLNGDVKSEEDRHGTKSSMSTENIFKKTHNLSPNKFTQHVKVESRPSDKFLRKQEKNQNEEAKITRVSVNGQAASERDHVTSKPEDNSVVYDTNKTSFIALQ